MMSRKFQRLLAVGALGLLAGCVQPRYEPIVYTDAASAERWTFEPVELNYIDAKSPAWNFQDVLEHYAGRCGHQAAMGYILYSQLRGYGSSKRPDESAQALADCQKYAIKQGNEAIARLRQANVSAKTLDLSKDLYAKWSAYLSGMSISDTKDRLAANQYEMSRRTLLAEDKFTQ